MKIVFLDRATLGDTPLEPISELGELVTFPNCSPSQARENVADAEVIIANKTIVDKALIDAAPKLRLICVAATGVNNIDLEEARRRGIPVKNVAGYSTDSVVQDTFMHMLSLAGNGPYFDNRVKSGDYSRDGLFTDVSRPFVELAGKTLGIIGMGAIGSKVAKVGEALGMKAIYFSTSGTNHCTAYPAVSLERLLKEADVVSIHAPLNVRTAGLIGRAELKLMKPTAFIINMGRGGIIDEAALAEAIDKEWIGGAATDVYVREPIEADNPLLHTRHSERLRFTPHTAWASNEARTRLVDAIAENIKSFLRGE